MTDTLAAPRHDPERRTLEIKLNTALPAFTDRSVVLSRALGDAWNPHDVTPLETLRQAVEVELPAFLAERAADAKAAAELAAHETRYQHRNRYERIKAAVLGGLGITDRGELASSQALAQAKADAEAEAAHEDLVEEGARERAKAEAALAKSKAKAVAEVRKAMPVLDKAALDAAVAEAKAAVDKAAAARLAYADQVRAVGEVLLAGGFERYPGFGEPEGGTGVAASFVVLESELLSAQDVTRHAFADLRDYVDRKLR